MLDMYTAIYVIMISFVIGTILLCVMILRNNTKQTPINYLLIGAFVLQTIGYIAFTQRDEMETLLNIFVSNVFIISGVLVLAFVIHTIYESNTLKIFYVGYGLLYILLIVMYSIWNPLLVARFYIFYIGHMLIYLWILIPIRKQRRNGDFFLHSVILFFVINFLIMAILTRVNTVSSAQVFSHHIFTFNTILAGLFQFLLIGALYVLDDAIIHLKTEEQSTEIDILRHVYLNAPIPSVTMTTTGQIVEANLAFSKLFSYDPENSTDLCTMFEPHVCERVKHHMENLSQKQQYQSFDTVVLANGIQREMQFHIQRIISTNRKLILVHILDKTSETKQQSELTRYHNILYQVKAIGHIGIWELTLKDRIIHADENAFEIYGLPYDNKGIPLQIAQDLVLREYRSMMDKALEDLIIKDIPYDVQFQIATPDGINKYIHSMATKHLQGEDIIIYGSLQDVTRSFELNQTINQLQLRDPLTGFINQQHFPEELHSFVQEDALPLSVIYGDLDNLSLLIQTYGLDIGNEAIKTSSEMMTSILPDTTLMGRTGDDEFIFVIPNCTSQVANRYIKRFDDELKGRFSSAADNSVSWSFGTATMSNILESISEVLQEAKQQLVQNQSLYNQSKQIKALDAIMATLNSKDPYSDIHSTRVAFYAKLLARAMNLSKQDIVKIETAALLHDIGKILVDNHILLKDTKLTDEEYKEIQQHPINSYNIIATMPELKDIARIVLAHHEWIDGNGYPYHIKGDSIPMESKIIAIADAYDAMTGKRRYRKPYVKEEAVLELLEHRGTQFDTNLVNTFVDEVLMKEKPNTSS